MLLIIFSDTPGLSSQPINWNRRVSLVFTVFSVFSVFCIYRNGTTTIHQQHRNHIHAEQGSADMIRLSNITGQILGLYTLTYEKSAIHSTISLL